MAPALLRAAVAGLRQRAGGPLSSRPGARVDLRSPPPPSPPSLPSPPTPQTVAPGPLHAAVAGLRQRAGGPLSSRPAGARVDVRSLHMGRGRGQVCRYNPSTAEERYKAFKTDQLAADGDRADLRKMIERIENQPKPWFTSTVGGRSLEWTGPVALAIAFGDILSRLLGS